MPPEDRSTERRRRVGAPRRRGDRPRIALVGHYLRGARRWRRHYHFYSETSAARGGEKGHRAGHARSTRTQGAELPSVKFTDVTEAAGITFHAIQRRAWREAAPGNHGRGLRLLRLRRRRRAGPFVHQWHRLAVAASWRAAAPAGPPPTMALYRNDGAGHFTDITAGSGLDVPHLRHGRRARRLRQRRPHGRLRQRRRRRTSFTTKAAGNSAT